MTTVNVLWSGAIIFTMLYMYGITSGLDRNLLGISEID